MHDLFERAKPDDVDLLSEIRRIDPATLVAMDAVEGPLSLLAIKVVNWLRVSLVFLLTKTQIIQSNFPMTLQSVPRDVTAHHKKPSRFGGLWPSVPSPFPSLSLLRRAMKRDDAAGLLLQGPRRVWAFGFHSCLRTVELEWP